MSDQQTIAEFLDNQGIAAEFNHTDQRVRPGVGPYNVYDVTFTRGDTTVTMEYGTSVHNTERGIEPTAEDAFDALLSDAQAFDGARDFDDFAAEFGLNDGSVSISEAIRVYDACDDQRTKLGTLLGDDTYLVETAMYRVERL